MKIFLSFILVLSVGSYCTAQYWQSSQYFQPSSVSLPRRFMSSLSIGDLDDRVGK